MTAIIYSGLLVCCLVMIARNQWVFTARARILDDDLVTFLRLPSYNYMMLHFWCWNIDSFLSASGISYEEAEQRLANAIANGRSHL